MARLPTIGGDEGNWGNVLNEFLRVSHGEEGSLKSVPNVFNVKDFGAKGDGITDDTAAIKTALDYLMSGQGGMLFFPPGTYKYSSTITLSTAHKPITFQGAGASLSGTTNGATILKWTGGASITIDIGTDVRNVTFRDINFENTGTATTCVRVGFTDAVRFENVQIRPTTFYSTAAIVLGIGANRCESVFFDHVTIRGNAAADVGIAADRAHDLRAVRMNLVNCKLMLGIAGSVDIVNAAFFGCSFSSVANTTAVTILQGRSIAFHGCHFENDGTGYAFDIPSTAGEVKGVAFHSCYFSGAHAGNATAYIGNVNLAGAEVGIYDAYSIQYTNPSYLIKNQNSQKIVLIGNSMNDTGASLSDSFTNGNGVIAVGNNVAGIPVSDRIGTLITKASPHIDIRAYGAVGDDFTDNTTAIQAALNAVPSNGGIVFVPPGTFRHTALTVTNPTQIIGSGGIAPGGSTLKFTGTMTNAVTLVANSDGTIISNVKLFSDTATTGIGIYSAAAGSLREIRIEHCEIEGFLKSIYLDQCINGVIDQIRIIGQGKATANGIGIRLSNATLNSLRNCYIAKVETGVHVVSGDNTGLYTCTFDFVKTGIKVAGDVTLVGTYFGQFNQGAGDRIIDESGGYSVDLLGVTVFDHTSTRIENPSSLVTLSSPNRTKILFSLRECNKPGSVIVSGDFSLSAGWGTTASVSSVLGHNMRGRFTVTSSGTWQSSNPTITYTPSNGEFITTPFAIVARNGWPTDQVSILPTWTTTKKTLVITFPGTPVAGESYTFEFVLVG